MDLAVQVRNKFGKGVKSLRKQGLIPAELYGRGIENAHLSVSAKEFMKAFNEAGTNTVINLLLGGDVNSGEAKRPVVIHDVGRHYLTGEVDHVDFYQVRMDEKIRAKVPLDFIGSSPAVKDLGGILNKTMLEVEVETLPADLPHRLEADLSLLKELNKSIYISDIKVPPGVEILAEQEAAVATAVEPREEEEEKPAEEVDMAAVKVEAEEKKEEREKDKKEEEGGTKAKAKAKEE